MAQYFNLNIKHPHYDALQDDATQITGAAAHWLGQRGKGVVYFGIDTVESIREAKKPIEAFNFIRLGDNKENWDTCFVITIQNGNIWIYKPAGKVEDAEEISFKRKNSDASVTRDILKVMKVEMLTGFPKSVSQVPLILASMKVNQAFSRNTFREIDSKKYKGNIAAIQYATGHWEPGFEVDPLEFLSSIELETLVAKLFEAHNCFVPAYKGGFLADVDLFVTPRSRVELADLILDPSAQAEKKKTWSIQVKLSEENSELKRWLSKDTARHLLITLNRDEVDGQPRQQFNREWIRNAVKETPTVHEWLLESLKWLPKEYQKPPLHTLG